MIFIKCFQFAFLYMKIFDVEEILDNSNVTTYDEIIPEKIQLQICYIICHSD